MHNPFLLKHTMFDYIPDFEITRALPASGDIVVKAGQTVLPFTKLARTRVSDHAQTFDANFTPTKTKKADNFYFAGEKLGRRWLKIIRAPYNGYLTPTTTPLGYLFTQEERDFWLLSGVWGVVSAIKLPTTVYITARVLKVPLAFYHGDSTIKELIVFPNPDKTLDLEYLKRYVKNPSDKIVYVGHTIRKDLVLLATQLGVGVLLGGGITKEAFDLAKSINIAIGTFSGFGDVFTPDKIYELLKSISDRHVFFDVVTGGLIIPIPGDAVEANEPKASATCSYVESTPGQSVISLNKETFGQSGTIESVQPEAICVKLNESKNTIMSKPENLLAV